MFAGLYLSGRFRRILAGFVCSQLLALYVCQHCFGPFHAVSSSCAALTRAGQPHCTRADTDPTLIGAYDPIQRMRGVPCYHRHSGARVICTDCETMHKMPRTEMDVLWGEDPARYCFDCVDMYTKVPLPA